MTWCRSPSPVSLVARFGAIVMVIAWTIIPGLCGGLFEAEHTHADVAAHDHVGGDAHSNKLVSCCRSLADAKFLTAAPAELQPIKMILIAVLNTVGKAEAVIAVAAKPVASSTGPPRTRHTRFLSYSPLAPPVQSA